MNFQEFVRFAYGLVMGTSMPYLKPTKRFLFPIHRHEVDREFGLLLGGSSVCGVLARAKGDVLVVNANQGGAAGELRAWVEEKTGGRGGETVVLTSLNEDFSGGLSLFGDAAIVYVGPSTPALLREKLAESDARIEVVNEEKQIEVAGERLRLIPVGPAATASDLVVYVENRKALFLGPLFYNRIHPILRPGPGLRADAWVRQLESLLSRFSDAKIFVPAEGDVGDAEDVRDFVGYLKSLMDPAVEFTECRAKYDWPEIPSYTSLEENFDLLRGQVKSHTTL